MHFKLDEIPYLSPPREPGGGCMRSVQAGEMDIGATWTAGPADYSSVYEGLPGNVCPCDHYGYIFYGRIRARYQDGSEEIVGPGEVYHIPKGHVLIYEEATHHLEINNHAQLKYLMDHVLANGARAKPGNGDNQ